MTSVIYEPRGRAKEYSNLACNLFNGCEHGCVYCYAPACLRQTKIDFHNKVTVRANILKNVQKDLDKMFPLPDMFTPAKENTEKVLLCFTSDPYQGTSDFNEITRDVLKLFKRHQVPFQILTKGGMKAVRDFDLYGKNDAFACTLTLGDNAQSLQFEPNAALPDERIQALQTAHDQGIETWVSFEPVLDANSVYGLFDKTKDFVDLYKIGTCSGPYSSVKNWSRFGHNIIALMENNNNAYYLKKDLNQYL